MSSLINFRENLNDNITNSLLDYVNYLHETKNNSENLDSGSDTLSKCVVLCGELFSGNVKKGKIEPEEIESFESLLPNGSMFAYNHIGLDEARRIVKESNAAALNEYETTFGEANKTLEQKKIA